MNHGWTMSFKVAAVLVAIQGVGCRWHDGWLFGDPCADIPRGAIPRPLGSNACEWQTAQMNAAEADDFVIYEYEWRRDSAELGPAGQRHVAQIATRVSYEPQAILIAPSENGELDEARRESLVATLSSAGVQDAERRVVGRRAVAEGLHGDEAPRLELGYLRAGTRIGGGGGAGGGAGGVSGGNAGGGYGGGGVF